MSSWVRYSVAVYLGLLLAGSMMAPQPQVSVGSDAMTRHDAVGLGRAARPAASPQADERPAQSLQTPASCPHHSHLP